MKFFICSPHENYIARVRAKGMKRWWGELGSGSGSVKKALKRIWHENLGTRRMNGMKKLLLLNDRFKIASSRHCCRWYSGKHNTPFHINVVLCICEIFHRAQCEAAAAVFIKYKNLERERSGEGAIWLMVFNKRLKQHNLFIFPRAWNWYIFLASYSHHFFVYSTLLILRYSAA